MRNLLFFSVVLLTASLAPCSHLAASEGEEVTVDVVAQKRDSGSASSASGSKSTEETQHGEAVAIVRRDPEGKKGISPYAESMLLGDGAYVAGDHPAAAGHYREALVIDPGNASAHLRLGRTLLSMGDADGAEREWLEASKLSSKQLRITIKALLLLADLRERQGRLDEAISSYQVYGNFASQHPEAASFPQTADSRVERIRHYQQMVEQYAAVKERIRLRAEEAEQKLRDSSR